MLQIETLFRVWSTTRVIPRTTPRQLPPTNLCALWPAAATLPSHLAACQPLEPAGPARGCLHLHRPAAKAAPAKAGWLAGFRKPQEPTVIYDDNNAAAVVAQSAVIQRRARHIDLRYFKYASS